ncbi:MAG: hypothetical protein R3F29_09175 [Planctomycetota bacterium]
MLHLPLLISASLLTVTTCLAQEDRPKKRPLPSGPEVLTQAAYEAQRSALFADNLVLDYRSRCGDRQPDAEFETLLRAWPVVPKHIAIIVDRAAHRAPPDPLMYWLAAETEEGDATQKRQWFDTAIAELKRLEAMPMVRLFVAMRARARLGADQRDPYLRPYCDAMVACAGDARLAGLGQRWMIDMMRELWPSVDSNARFLVDRMLAAKATDRYAALTLDGWCHVSEAWDSRSSKAAREVTQEGWKGFEEHLEAAAESLMAAHRLHPEFPEAAARMITVCGGSGAIDDIRGWLDAAVAAQFDYREAYTAALHFYSARWGGSPMLQLGLGRECAKTERFDTLVPQLLRNAIGGLANDTQQDLRDAFTKKIQQQLDAMHEKRMAQVKTVREANWELSQRGVELIMFRRAGEGAELLQSLGNAADLSAVDVLGGAHKFIAGVREKMALDHVPETVAQIDLYEGWEEPTYPGAATRRPLPVGADQPTEMQNYFAWVDFLTEVTEVHYRRQSTDAEELRARVAEVIGQFLPMLTRQAGAPSQQQYLRTLQQLRKDGATDPLLTYYEARTVELQGRVDQAIEGLRASLDGMRERGYAPLFQLLAQRRLTQLAQMAGDEAALPELRRETSRLALETARMDTWDAEHRQFYLSLVWPDNVLPIGRGELLTEDVQQLANDDRVDPWIRAVVEGIDCCQRAVVRPQRFFDGDPDYFALSRRASKCLRRAHQLDPHHPTAAAMMTSVCLLDPQPEPARQWFDAAVAARCDHLLAYRGFAVTLSPMAGGDRRSAMHFARECVDSGRFDTQIPNTFLETIASTIDAEPAWRRYLWASPALRDGLAEMLAGYDAVPGGGRYYHGLRAVVEWVAGRYHEALPLWQANRSDCQRWCDTLELSYDIMTRDLEFTAARAKSDK